MAFKYIYRRFGDKAEEVAQRSAINLLMAEGAPRWAAEALITCAESRCRLKAEINEWRRGELDHFESVITGEVHVEFWPDAKGLDAGKRSQVSMF